MGRFKNASFYSHEPYQINTSYTLSLSPGALAKNAKIKTTQSWKFQIRQPLIVYLGVDQARDDCGYGSESGKTTPLTDDTFKIYDFDASPMVNL